MSVDWSNPNCPISRHFVVREALWLPSWDRMASDGDGLTQDAQKALLFVFDKLDLVRDFIGKPIRVHVAFRPAIYNVQIGGAPESCHVARIENGNLLAAVDFDAYDHEEDSVSASCDTLRSALLGYLAVWGLRMENNPPGSPWVHLDTKPIPAGGQRYFIP